MNKRIKKGTNKMVRCEFEIKTKTKILEKNPTNGGTPASDNRVKESTFVKIFVEPKFEKEKRVLRLPPAD